MKGIGLNFFRLPLIVFIALLLGTCGLDPWGWFVSSDPDTRFDESRAFTQPADLLPALPFSFVVIADTHISGDDFTAPVSRLASGLVAGDLFVLACGDLVQNGARADMESFMTFSGLLGGRPVYTVPGNHDMYNGGWNHYRELLGTSSYSFGTGTVRFIALDTASGTLGGKQRAWLESQLDSRTEEHCVVFTHMQLFNTDITETQQLTDPEEILWLMNLLVTHEVDCLFMGHSHKDDARIVRDTDFCTVGTYRTSYIRVTVTGSGVSHQYFNY